MSRKFSIRSAITNWLNPTNYQSPIPINLGDGSLAYLNTHNPEVALSFTAVYACVNVISESIATLPCNLFTYSGEKKVKAYNHPLYNILHYWANERTTAATFWETTLMHLLLQGNSYSEIVRDKIGNIKELNILDPSRISIYKKDDGEIFYRYFTKTGMIDLEREKVLHIRGKSYDGIVGMSPISLFRRTISTGIKQEEHTNKFFANGAKKMPILSHPGGLKPETREKLKKDLSTSWEQSKVILLEEGIKTDTITMNMSDAQLLESKIFSVNEICRIFRVPPHKVAELSKATFSNIEHQSMDFVRDTLLPWCVRIEQAINLQLFSIYETGNYFVKFNMEALLRGDTLNRNRALEIQYKNGIINREDWAKMEDLPIPTDKHAKDYFITQQIRPITEAYNSNNKLVNNENNKEDDNNANAE